MNDENPKQMAQFISQLAAILALAVFAWSTATGGELTTSVVRAAMVYIAIAVMGHFAAALFHRAAAEADRMRVEAALKQREEQRRAGAAAAGDQG